MSYSFHSGYSHNQKNRRARFPTARVSKFSIFSGLWYRFRRAKPARVRHSSEHYYNPTPGLRSVARGRFQATVKKMQRRKLITGSGLIILSFAWFGALLYLPYFCITAVVISGLSITDKSEVERAAQAYLQPRFIFLPEQNYFLTRAKGLETELQQKFNFRTVKIKKIFPNRLEVLIEEKLSSLIYDDGQAYYLLDPEGKMIKQLAVVGEGEFFVQNAPTATSSPVLTASATSGSLARSGIVLMATSSPKTIKIHIPAAAKLQGLFGALPIVFQHGISDITLAPDRVILSSSTIGGVLSWQHLANESSLIKIKYYTLDQEAGGVTVHTQAPWLVYFQPQGDTADQFNNLQVLLKNAKPQQYVDVRYAGKVFWK